MARLLGVQNQINTGAFAFSAVRADDLTETEYTLATIVVDVTSSVADFADELLQMLKSTVGACQKSPRAENVLVRVLTFNTRVDEVHGFRQLSEIDLNGDYSPLRPSGMTALYDATLNATHATLDYAKDLVSQDFDVNAIIFVITDGADNSSSASPADIAKVIRDARRSEAFGGMTALLIGINAAECSALLDQFKNEANLSQYIDMGDVTDRTLAKLAGLVSRSISSTSQSLATGSSQLLRF